MRLSDIILSNLSLPNVIFTNNIGVGTIASSEGNVISISVADAMASEGNGELVFRISSEVTDASAITFDYEAKVDNTLNNPASSNDFEATSGTARIAAGASSTTISISITEDSTAEPDETFRLLLTNPSSNAVLELTNNSAIGTILNDDLGEISDAIATIGDSQITLRWTNPVSNLLAGVTIIQADGTTSPADCSGGNQLGKITSHSITNLTNGAAYSFRICARSTSGSLSGGVTITALTPNVYENRDDDRDGVVNRIDIDDDGDGLIEIANDSQFYNIRFDLTGASYKTGINVTPDTNGCSANGCNGYELIDDITLSGQWTPIGSNSNRFTAIFDGNNNTISGLTITDNDDYVGLFSAIQ